MLIAAMSVPALGNVPSVPSASAHANSNVGIIKGIVRDNAGGPIADATVAFFRVGSSKLLKQVRSGSDGSFLARMIPGRYSVLAVAEGFNPVTINSVEVARAAQLNYGFKLERAGSGNTLPEKRLDRNNPKWVIRSAQLSRSIYQNSETDPSNETAANVDISPGLLTGDDEHKSHPRPVTVVESYFAATSDGPVSGLNAATRFSLSDDSEMIVAGQTGLGHGAPQRVEAQLVFRPGQLHQIRVSGSFASFNSGPASGLNSSFSQVSIQATDEWRVREGVILVFGFDYSKFIGAGGDFSITPRLGLQYDIDPRTRFRTAYTTHTEERTWTRAIEFENAQVMFREPVSVEDFAFEEGKAVMNKGRRLEFGIERVLDNRSSVEANVFFDTTLGRGVGLTKLPFDSLDPLGFNEFTVNQQGNAQGLRVVYSRRLGHRYSVSAGYSFGVGQKLSDEKVSNPADLFQNDIFQSFFGQFEADFASGTNVRTIFRLSPQATVFAIDPFRGRLAIYDPSLSVLVTQNLPTLGLPFQAEAVVDARNLLDFAVGISGDDGVLRLTNQRRALRGGILVRF
ncbi:MAG TPA: carboxypeptidase-like regulatory domain-containing protein [Pyrinomonadaceae bacterium]|nr:carboxypeptidase-like regulatory domain-containing protein [Pyrinomonadaceae bacterium]